MITCKKLICHLRRYEGFSGESHFAHKKLLTHISCKRYKPALKFCTSYTKQTLLLMWTRIIYNRYFLHRWKRLSKMGTLVYTYALIWRNVGKGGILSLDRYVGFQCINICIFLCTVIIHVLYRFSIFNNLQFSTINLSIISIRLVLKDYLPTIGEWVYKYRLGMIPLLFATESVIF